MSKKYIKKPKKFRIEIDYGGVTTISTIIARDLKIKKEQYRGKYDEDAITQKHFIDLCKNMAN